MKTLVDQRVVSLATGPKHWFCTSDSPNNLIRDTVSSSVKGVYCLWWKDATEFPTEKTVELPAGKRGVISLVLKPWMSELTENIALYVGKGSVRTRIASHVKSARCTEEKQSRNPYEWLVKIFGASDVDRVIRDNIGFSYISETNKLDQIYTENLAIGILRPWFNIRLTS
jgi:hypothetical protein